MVVVCPQCDDRKPTQEDLFTHIKNRHALDEIIHYLQEYTTSGKGTRCPICKVLGHY